MKLIARIGRRTQWRVVWWLYDQIGWRQMRRNLGPGEEA